MEKRSAGALFMEGLLINQREKSKKGLPPNPGVDLQSYQDWQATETVEENEKRDQIQIGNHYLGIIKPGGKSEVFEVLKVEKYNITIRDISGKEHRVGLSHEMFKNPV